MRKTMAKFLSVVCVIALAFSVCTFSVMAEESVLSALTAEKLAVSNGVNQVPTCIVNNLTLPEIDGVTWSSSNPAVLANDGTVTRPVAEDANVTLTATAGEETKSFNFTVKAYTTEVHYQDSFAYASRDKFLSRSSGSTPWYTYGDDNTSTIKTDSEGNTYATFDLKESAAAKRKPLHIVGGMIYLEFDMKVDPEFYIDFTATVGGKNKNDNTDVSKTFYLFRIHTDPAELSMRPFRTENIVANCGKYTNDYTRVRIRFDMANKQIYLTGYSGVEIGPYNMGAQIAKEEDLSDYDFDTLQMFEAKRASSSTSAGTFSLDNFVVYTEKSVDEALLAVPAEQQLDYIISDLEEKFPLTDNAQITSARTFDLPTYGGLVSWTDANGNALGESVTLTQNQTTFNTGKLIATISPVGGAAKTYTYAYSVLPIATSIRTRVGNKAAFSFDGDWCAPTTMNNKFNTDMLNFMVYGEKGKEITEGITWTTDYESESEIANKVGKFINATTDSQSVAIDMCGGNQHNRRIQKGASFKVTEGNEVAFYAEGSGTYPTVTAIFNFNNGTLTVAEGFQDIAYNSVPTPREITYNLADYGVTKDSWTRVEFDCNNVGSVYDLYVNGIKVNDVPLNYGVIHSRSAYGMHQIRIFKITVPAGGTVLLDNVAIAESTDTNADVILGGVMRRLERNLATTFAFANGETIYSNLLDEGGLPGTAYVNGTNNFAKYLATHTISWKLDGVALPEVDGRVPLSFTGMGKHTLEATVTYNDESATKTFEITGAPVALRVLDTRVPGVKLGSDISGKLIVAQYTDSTMKVLDNVKIYNYTNGVCDTGAFEYNNKDFVQANSRLFFISDNFAPIAFDVAR